MSDLLALASVIVLGVGAQWLAWRIKLPSILLLLLVGIGAGPGMRYLHDSGITAQPWFLDPDTLFGPLLLPFVSLSVGLILYEGGLTLKFSEMKATGAVVRNLVTVGVLVTWLIASLLGRLLLGLDWQLAVLLGAVLTVTGPTVIQPLLQHIRPSGRVGPILKWEGIVIDPIGALLAVLVFEVILAGDFHHVPGAILKTIVFGGLLGLCGAALLVLLLKRYWVPEYLQNAMSLTFAVAVFAGANQIQHESGLFAVTFMGILLANQRFTQIEHIIEFKENLRVLLISSLFILLGARLTMAQLQSIGVATGIFVALLILVVRPLAVWMSTLGSKLVRNEKLFIAWMAPRGIVAAAVSSVFAFRLEGRFADAGMLVSCTFAVIIGTVLVYGLSAKMLAVRLSLAQSNPQGILMIGAEKWMRAIAETLKNEGFRVLLVDTNRENATAARMAGLPAHYGSALNENFLEDVELGGIGRLLALTPNDSVNVLAAQRFTRIFGKANVYQLPTARESEGRTMSPDHLAGRPLFGKGVTYMQLYRRVSNGDVVKATRLTDAFDYKTFRERYPNALPLFIIKESNQLQVITAESEPQPQAGQTIISLVRPDASKTGEAKSAQPASNATPKSGAALSNA